MYVSSYAIHLVTFSKSEVMVKKPTPHMYFVKVVTVSYFIDFCLNSLTLDFTLVTRFMKLFLALKFCEGGVANCAGGGTLPPSFLPVNAGCFFNFCV